VATRAASAPSATGARANVFWLGLTAGIVYFAGTLYWVVGVMTTYGGLQPAVAGLTGLLLVAYLALYPAVFAVLLGRAVRRFGVRGVWLSPLFWVATEWVRSWLGTGFPWVLLGASQARVVPVAQLASVTGVYGLSCLVALASAALAAVSLSRRRAHVRGALAVGVLVVLIAVAGVARVDVGALTSAGRVLRVGIVQGSIEQDVKWSPAFREPTVARYLSLSREALIRGASLVVWPESSTPFFFEIESALAEPVRRLAAETRTPFLIGTDEYERRSEGGVYVDRSYNSAVLVGADGLTHGAYRKMHLVPFGEYVPLKRLLFFVAPLVEQVSDFAPGTDPVILDLGAGGQGGSGGHVSVSICYESVYPAIARTFVQRGSELLVTITNDAWFGRSSAAYQHFDQGVLRAIEEGRYMVRAANTGVSGVVDPYGRVVAETPLFEPTQVVEDVRLLDVRTIYNRTGDLIAWLSLVASAFVALPRVKNNKQPPGSFIPLDT
jgi:apolipoprotein N-acyltransferase